MKLEINIPTELKEIKLLQYQKFLEIAKDNPESEFLQQKMVQLFCGIDLKDVAQIKYTTVKDISESLGALFSKEHKFIPHFKMGGVEFGFIPNLEEITFGEYTDLDTYISDWTQMNKAMAVLYRPIIKKGFGSTYEIEKYNGSITYSDVMKHAPLDVVLGAVVFFYHLGNELLTATLNYLENNQEVQNILNKHNSENVGDGIQASMLLVKETLENLMPQQNFHYTNV
jgi:hypothetical protein